MTFNFPKFEHLRRNESQRVSKRKSVQASKGDILETILKALYFHKLLFLSRSYDKKHFVMLFFKYYIRTTCLNNCKEYCSHLVQVVLLAILFFAAMWQLVTACDCVWRLVTVCDGLWRGVTACWLCATACVTGCDGLLLCVTACDWVWLLVTGCDGLWRSVTACDGVWRLVTECDYLWLCVTACDGVWQSVTTCDCV